MIRENVTIEYKAGTTPMNSNKSEHGRSPLVGIPGEKGVKGQVEILPLDEDQDEGNDNTPSWWGPALADVSKDEGDSPEVGAATVLAGLALVGLTVSAVSAIASAAHSRKEGRREREWRIAQARQESAHVAIATQRVAAPAGWYDDGSGRLRWWDGQMWTEHYYAASPRVAAPAGWYDDGSGQQRWWDGQDWTAHYQGSQPRDEPSPDWRAALGGSYSSAVESGNVFSTITLSRAQWEEQVRVMLLQRQISELQWRLLSNARIEDADSDLRQWQSRLRTLTAEEFSQGIDRYVACRPDQALQLAIAGWYDDGSGRQRWWDGLEWTDYLQTDESRMLLPGR